MEEQIELVEALWDSIVERNAVPGPTEAQKAELDRRLLEHAANPDDVVPWSEAKASALLASGDEPIGIVLPLCSETYGGCQNVGKGVILLFALPIRVDWTGRSFHYANRRCR